MMNLICKLEGNAATCVYTDHGFKWKNIEKILKDTCGDNREFNTLIVELMNLKRKGSFKDFISDLKQKLFYIKSKLLHSYNDQIIVDAVMMPYLIIA